MRPVRISPAARSTPSALLTASREAPVQPASSSWENGSADLHAVGDRLAEPLHHLDQPGGDPAGRVVRAELDALAVGVASRPTSVRMSRYATRPWRLQVRLERGDRHDERAHGLQRGDRGRPCGSRSDRGELAEQRAGTAHGEHDLGAVRGVDRDLDPARAQHGDPARRLAPPAAARTRGGSPAGGPACASAAASSGGELVPELAAAIMDAAGDRECPYGLLAALDGELAERLDPQARAEVSSPIALQRRRRRSRPDRARRGPAAGPPR